MMARKHRATNRRLDLPEIKSYAPGIYARSETLVQATRDLDRGRISEKRTCAPSSTPSGRPGSTTSRTAC
jgi:hypothetical protein